MLIPLDCRALSEYPEVIPIQTKDTRSMRSIPIPQEKRSRETGEKDGFKDIAMRTREKTKRILREHVPNPVEKNIASDLAKHIKKTTEAHSD